MNTIKVNTDNHVAPGYWALSDCMPHAITGLVKAETIAKWRGRNDILLRPGEYTVTAGIVGGTDLNSLDKLILSQIVQNGRWLLAHNSITDLRAAIVTQCEQNDIRPTEQEIADVLKEQE